MKRILIVVATSDEWSALLNAFEGKAVTLEDGVCFVQEEETEWTLMKGGIGKVAMAFSLGRQMVKKEFDLVLNTGVAGALFKRLKPLEALCATKTAFYDVFLPGLKRGQMAGQELYFECSKRVVELAKKLDKEIETGVIVTGDNFITKDNLPENLDQDFERPVAIDMESAAVGQCCAMAKVPYGILRTISDDTGSEGNEEAYFKNLSEACRAAVRLALAIARKF